MEQNNNVMKECILVPTLRHVCDCDALSVVLALTAASVIASKSQESDYESVAATVFLQVEEYNKSLIESLQNNRS